MLLALGGLFAAFATGFPTVAVAAGATFGAEARVAASVAQKAARQEPVDVLIVLDDAAEEAQLTSTVGPPSRRARLARTEYESFLGRKRLLMRALKSDVLLGAAEPDLQLLTDYDTLPVVHARIKSARALERLKRQGRIKLIDEIVATRVSLVQSLPLVHQPEAEAIGAIGTGATVAVLDTGVDYTRAAFGACSSPGGNCKVAVAQDFAAQDNALDANGHGTNVAGIVLGVAPGARIAALDVFESSGTAYSNVIINAINWCIANRATYNIVAINMSLGGGRYYAAQAPSDAWGTAITNAVGAGIVVVAASGNNAYTDSISAPAAYSNVVSVGATYDANIGGLSSGVCSDATTAAGKITCFSNSASFLTLLAPGATITAAGITQSGTSQAAPHVAGAVAVLKANYPDDSVAQTIERLKLGATITDPRNGVAKPALDLMASMAIPPATYRLIVGKTGSGTGTVTSTPTAIDCGSSCTADIANGDSVTLTALQGAGSMFNGWSGACSGSSLSCTLPMTAARSVSALFNARTAEDFLAAGSLPSGWSQPAGSNAAWLPVSSTAYVGTQALQAGAVAHGQSSAISVSGQFAAGVLSFARRVSSESGGDFLRFYVDDQLQGSWSGEVPWGMVSFPISAGTHVLKWAYEKNGAGVAGSDSAWIDSVTLPYAAASRAAAPLDFNGDGRADVLWRHGGTGLNALWLMDGAIRQNGSGPAPQVADLNWRVAGTGDFDGDGKADILWRHAVNGQYSVWTMNGTARLSATVLPTVADLNWRVVAVADFDGDGKADLFWRNIGNGQNAIWLMDGATRRSATTLPAAADIGWQVVGAGDFDADGKADLLWRHAGSGKNAIWLMDGATRLGSTEIPATADLGWKVVGVADFDGDGKADILWRHGGNGQNAIWLMDGTTRRSGTLIPATADLGWTVAGVGDFDADGKADILWRHTVSGRNALWTMNGSTRLASILLEDVTDLAWQIVSP